MGFVIGVILGAALWHFGRDIAIAMWNGAPPRTPQPPKEPAKPEDKAQEPVAGGVYVRFVDAKSGLVYLRDHPTIPFSAGIGHASRFNTIERATKAMARQFPSYTGYYDVIDQHGNIWFQQGATTADDSFSAKIGDAMLKDYLP
jgi:hypothetical protein